MTTLEILKAAFLEADRARDLAWKEFSEAAVANGPCQVGDTVKTAQYGKPVVVKIVAASLERGYGRERDMFGRRYRAYPIKKNGTVAKVGEVRINPGYDPIEVISRASGEAIAKLEVPCSATA